MAAVQNIPMLSCSDIYFVNDDGKYRLQWSTNALVEGISKPVLDDDDYDEYYRQLAKYNYIKKHKNDSSNTAAKFLCRVYDYQTGNLIKSIQTDGFCAEFDLASGEYLWDVQALDDKGNVITSSGKNYICTFPCNNNSSGVSAKDSSQYHTISHSGDSYGNSFRLAVAIEINSHDGNTANFIVCGPSQNGPHMDWEAAIEGGFDFSDSNAFDGFTGNFCMGKDTMISSRGIYEYENGQWNYKTFTESQYYASEAGFSNDFLFTDGGANGKTIYQWNSETDRLVSIQTAPGDVYGLSANYYICADGVFSINSGKKIINRKIFYGENLIYDDMYLNVVAQNNGKDCDTISEGQRGKIIARYFRFDSENNKVLDPYEVVLFDGKAENCEVESEEIFSCRIGNMFCYVFESDEGNTAKIHIWEDGKVREVSASFYGGNYTFYADNKKRLVLNCEGNAMVITDAGTVTYLPGIPEDISIVEDDRNNWFDLAANGSASKEIGKAEKLSDISGWVGDGDKADHWEFNLENAAKLKFDLSATDAAKFTISQLVEKIDRYGHITYSLKSLQSAAVKSGSDVTTKDLLLDKGTYYITMESTNAAKGGSADYQITLDNENSLFYDRADNGFDNWLYDKKSNELNDATGYAAIGDYHENWVGFGDAADYYRISSEFPAKVSFDLTATDAAKFTIWSVTAGEDKNGNVTYKVKSLQSTALKLDKATGKYFAVTKDLLLDNSDENVSYYYSMESTSAAKGCSADYQITLDNENSLFYDRADNGFDNWLYDKKSNELNDATGYAAIGDYHENWVGFGDAADYYRISSEFPAKVSFDLTATDAAKFTIWSVTAGEDKNGNVTYKVKSLQSTALKLDKATGKYSADTKDLLLDNSNENVSYYYSMESTSAAKGGNAEYSISSGNCIWFDYGNTADDEYENAGDIGTIYGDSDISFAEDWVGFGDVIDYHSFRVENDMELFFNISSTDAVKFSVCQLVNGSLKELPGGTAVKADSSVSTKAFSFKSGNTYYIAVKSTNAAKGGNAHYAVSGEKYVKPLNITLDGEEWDEAAEDNLPDNEERYQNGPECSGQADKITFAGDRLHLISDIDMKGGNDLITIQKSANEGMVGIRGELIMGDGNDKIMINSESELFVGGGIDFGDGNDILQLAGDNDVTASEIHFGDGNDLLDVKNESDIWANINFGNGNGTMNVGCSSVVKSEQLSFGEGRNTLQIDNGGAVFFDEIYFGMDSNTLILNGTLGISYADFSTVDQISGSGQLLINAWQTDVESLQCFADTDIDITAMFDMASAHYFSDRRTELADNTLAKAVSMLNDDEYKANFWICSQSEAGQNIYGFADEVDYMKFVKNDDCDMLAIESTGYNFTIDLLDAAGNILKSADPYIGTDVDISDLDNGKTYYVRVMTGEYGYGAGKICLYDN